MRAYTRNPTAIASGSARPDDARRGERRRHRYPRREQPPVLASRDERRKNRQVVQAEVVAKVGEIVIRRALTHEHGDAEHEPEPREQREERRA
jgi:hypothetical protein